MNRLSIPTRAQNFLFNAYQAVFGRGGQIDWTRVTSQYQRGAFEVEVNGSAAKGATSVPIDALAFPLKSGVTLDFGPQASVVATLTANKAIGQTSIAFTALTGPIPSGTILNFGVNKQAVTTAAAATGATSVAVEALDTALVSGDVATYQGGQKLAELTADAAAGATSLTVAALPYALADETATYGDATSGGDGRVLMAGTIMARTSADKLIPRADAAAETATEILQSDASEFSKSSAKSGFGTYRICQVFENLLPDADPDTGLVPALWKTEINALANAERANVAFSPWSDSRFVD